MGTVLKHWRWIVLIGAALAAFLGFKVWRTLDQPVEVAPTLTGVAVDGRPVDLARSLQAAKGKPVMVVFWATWCPDCLAEQDNIQSLSRDYDIVAVAWRSEDNDAVAKYMTDHKLGYPTLNDVDGALAKTWAIKGVPTHFIVGSDGMNRFRVEGSRPEWNLRARLWWAGRPST